MFLPVWICVWFGDCVCVCVCLRAFIAFLYVRTIVCVYANVNRRLGGGPDREIFTAATYLRVVWRKMASPAAAAPPQTCPGEFCLLPFAFCLLPRLSLLFKGYCLMMGQLGASRQRTKCDIPTYAIYRGTWRCGSEFRRRRTWSLSSLHHQQTQHWSRQ